MALMGAEKASVTPWLQNEARSEPNLVIFERIRMSAFRRKADSICSSRALPLVNQRGLVRLQPVAYADAKLLRPQAFGARRNQKNTSGADQVKKLLLK